MVAIVERVGSQAPGIVPTSAPVVAIRRMRLSLIEQPRAADTWSGKNAEMVAPLNQPRHHGHEQRNVSTALEHGGKNMRGSVHAITPLTGFRWSATWGRILGSI